MKEIKIGDLFIGKNEIFKVTHIFSSYEEERIYTCDTWFDDEGFVDNSDYDMFTDQHIEDFGFEIYSPK
jgi:hypothetical protein